MALSHKPLTTYTRRSRARAANKANRQASSPLEPLPAGTEDVTVTEMTRRMQKRSRQAASSITDDEGQTEEALQKLKKPKSGMVLDSNVLHFPATVNAAAPFDADQSNACPPLSQRLGKSDMVFCTPRPPACSDYAMMPSSVPRPVYSEQRELSPLPAAHHMLSRTSSRHLKENRLLALGSPFSSRPGSRAASPGMTQKKGKGKGKTQRPLRHVKTRTLSVPDTSRIVTAAQVLHPVPASGTTTEDVNAHQRPSASGLAAHCRTGSIPTVPSTQAGDWLAHSAKLHKNITIGASPTHASFFFDVPDEASTPPRKRRATTGGMRIETQDYDLTLSDMSLDSVVPSGAYTQSASRPSSPESNAAPRRPPVRMRRRTITNPSGGSLFSSVLDFSGSAAEEQRASFALDVHGVDSHNRSFTHKPQQDDHASLATAFSGLNVALASAFAPAPDATQPTLGHALHRSTSLPTLHASPPPAKLSGDSPGELPGSSDRQLRDLFVTLELCDVEETVSVPPSASRDFSKPPLGLQNAQLPLPKPSKRLPTHKRQRADTIRASDFALPSAPQITSGSASRQVLLQAPAPLADATVAGELPRTRRSRSGTVTLASVAASTVAARRPAGRSNDGHLQELASPNRGHKRTVAGLPTIQMRTNSEPLKLDAGDDEDDELLLKRGSTID